MEEVRIQKLHHVRQAGSGAPGGPSGAGQRDVPAGARRDGVQSEVRGGGRRRARARRGRPRLVRGVRPAVRGQNGPVLRHAHAQRQAVGRRDRAVGPEAGRGRGRRVRSIRYCTHRPTGVHPCALHTNS